MEYCGNRVAMETKYILVFKFIYLMFEFNEAFFFCWLKRII